MIYDGRVNHGVEEIDPMESDSEAEYKALMRSARHASRYSWGELE